ncbi:hypothetical protein JW823_09090 [bacterium]|nr:hypothetical protein [candidate division CSSED10-310 bacterium]
MTLFQKEVRESGPLVLFSAGCLFIAGWVLNLTRDPSFPEMIRPFIVIRFIIGICLCSVLGATIFAGDRERGTHHFLAALPLSPGRLFLIKTLTGLAGTAVFSFASCYPTPLTGIHLWQWWPLMFLAFSIGQFCGVELSHTVNASALSSAIGLGAFSGFAGSDWFGRHYSASVVMIFFGTAALMTGSRIMDQHRSR